MANLPTSDHFYLLGVKLALAEAHVAAVPTIHYSSRREPSTDAPSGTSLEPAGSAKQTGASQPPAATPRGEGRRREGFGQLDRRVGDHR